MIRCRNLKPDAVCRTLQPDAKPNHLLIKI
jgi:hypothetical protein